MRIRHYNRRWLVRSWDTVNTEGLDRARKLRVELNEEQNQISVLSSVPELQDEKELPF